MCTRLGLRAGTRVRRQDLPDILSVGIGLRFGALRGSRVWSNRRCLFYVEPLQPADTLEVLPAGYELLPDGSGWGRNDHRLF